MDTGQALRFAGPVEERNHAMFGIGIPELLIILIIAMFAVVVLVALLRR